MLETRASHPVVLRGDRDRVTQLLHAPGALLHGHFHLLGGAHTDRFFRFSTIARESQALDDIASWLDPDIRPLHVDGVLAPTTAGVGLGWTLANRLGVPLHLATVDDHGRPSGLLGPPDLDGDRLLLVNDVVTTGQGLIAMAQLTHARGAQPAAACWFLTRSDVDVVALLGTPCFPVVRWALAEWGADACQACARGDEPQLAYDLN